MARIPPIEEAGHPELAALVARIRGARGGRLLNLYRALLWSPPLAAAWLEFNDAVRRRTGLDERTRELAILRVALLNGADYVFEIHKARYAQPSGLTREELEALGDWRGSAAFGPRERALLAYVDAMTREVAVPQAVFEALRAHFGERETVELTVLVAAYNMHTRVLRALAIEPEKE
ncbi:MAG TPA: carboxymuconolactone decarboxylase family protein [Burkholderiales bacterium]|nr:carboxymuconolactone decarboxylase family protein [Burkholderiales bacterium]